MVRFQNTAEMFVLTMNTTVKTVEEMNDCRHTLSFFRSEKQHRYYPCYCGYGIGLRRFGSPA